MEPKSGETDLTRKTPPIRWEALKDYEFVLILEREREKQRQGKEEGTAAYVESMVP